MNPEEDIEPQNVENAASNPHGPRDIKMHAFAPDVDPDETGQRWKKWEKELSTRFRYFPITNTHDRVDAINIYGGEQIRELIETLPDVPTPTIAEPTECEKIIAKLNNHFTPMVNKDSARSKLNKMHQNKGESVAQYYVRLRKQAIKCQFADMDDAIRINLLHTLKDSKLRREAMVKSLADLLKHASSKEDVNRQASSMDDSLNVKEANRVHEKKPRHRANITRNPDKKPRRDDSGTSGAKGQACT